MPGEGRPRGGDWDTGYVRVGKDKLIIFANIGVAGRTGHDFANAYNETTKIFTWFGKPGTRSSQPTFQNLISGGLTSYIFARWNNNPPFTFLGNGIIKEYFNNCLTFNSKGVAKPTIKVIFECALKEHTINTQVGKNDKNIFLEDQKQKIDFNTTKYSQKNENSNITDQLLKNINPFQISKNLKISNLVIRREKQNLERRLDPNKNGPFFGQHIFFCGDFSIPLYSLSLIAADYGYKIINNLDQNVNLIVKGKNYETKVTDDIREKLSFFNDKVLNSQEKYLLTEFDFLVHIDPETTNKDIQYFMNIKENSAKEKRLSSAEAEPSQKISHEDKKKIQENLSDISQNIITHDRQAEKFKKKILTEYQKEKTNTKNIRETIFSKKLSELAFSKRVINFVNDNNLVFIGDLVEMTEKDLLSYPKFGHESLYEIKNILSNLHLSLGMDTKNWDLSSLDFEPEDKKQFFSSNNTQDSIFNDYLNLPLNFFNFSTRVENFYKTNLMLNIVDIVSFSRADYLAVESLGHSSIREIEDFINCFSLNFEQDISNWTKKVLKPNKIRELISNILENDLNESKGRFFNKVLERHKIKLSSFKEELEHFISGSMLNDREKKYIYAKHNISDENLNTLQSIAENPEQYGQEEIVTRERVRQILSKANRKLKKTSEIYNFYNWEKALEKYEHQFPITVLEFLNELGFKTSDWKSNYINAVKFALEILPKTYKFQLNLFERARYFDIFGGSFDFKRVENVMRKLDADCSYIKVSDLAEKLKLDMMLVTKVVAVHEMYEFLDDKKNYYWRKKVIHEKREWIRGNPFFGAIQKIFSVTSEIKLNELGAFIKNYRVFNQELPDTLLKSLILKSGFLIIDNGNVKVKEGYKSGTFLASRELDLIDLMISFGEQIIDTKTLFQLLAKKGLDVNNGNGLVGGTPLMHNMMRGNWRNRGYYKFICDPKNINLDKRNLDLENEELPGGDIEIIFKLTPRNILSGRLDKSSKRVPDGQFKMNNPTLNYTHLLSVKDGIISNLRKLFLDLRIEKGMSMRLYTDNIYEEGIFFEILTNNLAEKSVQ